MEVWQALVLGVVEGVSEFLPISSTGHLILAAHWLRIQGEAVKIFAVVIQSGALIAVLALYRTRVTAMWRGLLGQDPAGRRLLGRLLISVAPAVAAGAALHAWISAHLFTVTPVIAALAAGGLLMVLGDRWLRQRAQRLGRTIDGLTPLDALLIGVLQCLSLWPGTSRAMVTMVGGLLVGLPPVAAAEYSFLLALPTLVAATGFDLLKGGGALMADVGPAAVAAGFLAAAAVAALAMQGLVRYLTRHGFQLFGWYRIGLALVVWRVLD